jgi:hypothetical protein
MLSQCKRRSRVCVVPGCIVSIVGLAGEHATQHFLIAGKAFEACYCNGYNNKGCPDSAQSHSTYLGLKLRLRDGK